jgi:uncharacterized protein YndB with AHSA1/START domain
MSETAMEVRREARFEASVDELWEAITDQRMLAEWLADDVELEPVPGADARFEVDGEERRGLVLRVEDERSIAWTWARPGDAPSEVELTIDAVADGASRLVVVERATASAAAPRGLAWDHRLIGLTRALALVAA